MRRFVVSLILMVFYSFANAQNNNEVNQTTIVSTQSYKEYRVERYSDETSKMFDKKGNWIHFFTEYEKNEYTGETTSNPVPLQKFLPNEGRWIADIFEADIKNDNGYGLQMKDGRILIKTSIGCSFCLEHFTVIHEPYPLMKEGEELEKEKAFMNNYGVNRNGYIPKIIMNLFVGGSIKTYLEDDVFSNASEVLKLNYYVKGVDGRPLERKEILPVRYFPEYYIKILKNNPNRVVYRIDNGYYEESTNRVYVPKTEDVYLLVSPKTGLNVKSIKGLDVNSIRNEDIYFLDGFPPDTIKTLNCTDKVLEIRFNNGDYIKYSFLKESVFDCQRHCSDGVVSIKLEENKLVGSHEYTSGEYKGYTYINENANYGLSSLIKAHVDYYIESGAVFLDSKTKKRLKYERGSLLDPETQTYAYISKKMKREIEEKEAQEEAQRKIVQQKQKEIQTLYQKYGKKYVDAIRNNNKILIGTPEGLIVNHLNSSLIRESQYSRIYRIGGLMGGRAATVTVDKKTKKVSSVTY